MTDLQNQLQESIRELEQIRKIKEHTADLNKRLIEEQAALNAMELTLEKEQRDVEALEKEGLTSMFRKFLGDREERLEKERQEYLKASLRYNELFKSVGLIKFELDLLSKKEQTEDRVARRVEIQMKMREDEIIQLDPKIGVELKGFHDQTDRLQKFSVEVEEAFTAGSEALDFVSRAEYFLRQAQGWGHRDIWSSGRPGSGYMKYQAIDKAREMVGYARHALIRFVKEIKDVFTDLHLQVNLDIEAFNKFGDVFFDNIISDYLAQQKINKAFLNVSSTREQIEHIMVRLEKERGNIITKLDQLEGQRKEMILQAK